MISVMVQKTVKSWLKTKAREDLDTSGKNGHKQERQKYGIGSRKITRPNLRRTRLDL